MLLISREIIVDRSKGDDLRGFWRLFRLHEGARPGFWKSVLAFLCNKSAARHGGYVGVDAKISQAPSMPHGLKGVFISRYAAIGSGCRIYQNVTIGEVDGRAPAIGSNCLIGAGAVLVGGILIGDNVKIGAGAVVACDVPENCTVVSQPPLIISKEVLLHE